MISYDVTAFASTPKVCSKEKFMELINSEKVKRLCHQIEVKKRKMFELIEQGMSEEAKVLHEEVGKMKGQLPVLIPSSTYQEGSPRKIEFAKETFIVPIDIDYDANKELLKDPEGLDARIRALRSQWYEDMVLYAGISCSGTGLRYFVLRDPRYSFVETLEWFSKTFGVVIDPSGKDITRCSFVSHTDMIWKKDDRMFLPTEELKQEIEYLTGRRFEDYENKGTQRGVTVSETPTVGEGVANHDTPPTTEEVAVIETAAGSGKTTTAVSMKEVERNAQGEACFRGAPYRMIVGKVFEALGGSPAMGERNTKLHRAAVNLRYICDNNAELLFEILKPWANGLKDSELLTICKSATSGEMRYWSSRLIDAVMQSIEEGTDLEEADYLGGLEVNHAHWNSRLDEIHLVRGLRECTCGVPESFKMGCVLGSLVCIYTLLSRIRFISYDGREYRLSGQAFTVGEAGTGKSFMTQLSDLLLEPLVEQDNLARDLEDKWKEEKQKAGQGKMKTARPKAMVRVVPSGISTSMLNQRLKNAFEMEVPLGGGDPVKLFLHLITCEPEMASVIRQLGNQFSKYADYMLKGFQDEKTGNDYLSEQSASGIVEVHWNTWFAGVMSSLMKFVGDMLSGQNQRLMLYIMPTNRYQMIEKGGFNRTHEEKKAISEMARLLNGDEGRRIGGRVEVSELTDVLYDWCKNQMKCAESSHDIIRDRFCRREALKGIRAGIAYAVIENAMTFDLLEVVQMEDGEWARKLPISEDAKKFAILIADYCLEMDLAVFGEPTLQAMRTENMKQRKINSKYVRRVSDRLRSVFVELKHEFTIDDMVALDPSLSKTTAQIRAYRWQEKGFVTYSHEKKCYVKLVESI